MQSDVYVLCSDDPLLKNDKAQELLAQAKQKLVDADFLLYTWTDLQGSLLKELESEMSDPGLFGGDRIIKINLKDLDDTAVEVFKVIASNYRQGIFIVIDMPRINASFIKEEAKSPDAIKRTLSFTNQEATTKEIDKRKKITTKRTKKGKNTSDKKEAIAFLKGIGAQFIAMYPPDAKDLKLWIQQRGSKYNLMIEADALDLISQISDNNLLAIDQSLQVLSMLQINGKVNINMVENYFTQDSRYTGFELPVAICAGDSLKALNIIHSFCTSQGSNLSTSLSLLISRMDEALNVIYKGKEQKVGSLPYKETAAFFLRENIKVPSSQQAYLMAIQKMPINLLNTLTYHLDQASKAYSQFNNQAAYNSLQNMAMALKRPDQVNHLQKL